MADAVPMAAKDDLGRAGEDLACDYLQSLGYRILDRNWRGAGGEIDIVAHGPDGICVVEVKTRRTNRFGDPLAAVDARKQARLWRLAWQWVGAHPAYARMLPLRIDAIGIVGDGDAHSLIEHLQDMR